MTHYSELFNTRRKRLYSKSLMIDEIIKRSPKGTIKTVRADDSKIEGTRPTCIIYDDMDYNGKIT